MKPTKKQIRATFRETVFKRDNYKCKICGDKAIDAHHITDRHDVPNGGYVPENGISLCEACHLKAEAFHQTGKSIPGYSPEELYVAIGSSKELAISKASETH